MGSVAVVVIGDGIIFHEIPPVDVINVTIAVVVDPVAGDFAGVYPDPPRQIGMAGVDPAVDDGDHDLLGIGGGRPGVHRVDAMGVEKAPQVTGVGVI